jgi:hypothetical protein
VLGGSPAEFGKLIAEETEKWTKLIRALNPVARANDARCCTASCFFAPRPQWVKSGCEQVQKILDNSVEQMRPWPPSSIPQIPSHQLPAPCCTAPCSSPRGRIGGPGWTGPGRSLSFTASDRLVRSCCNQFHSVSKRHETANALIERENYPPVSPFHDFGESVTGNSKLWQFLPPFKLPRPLSESRETAKQQPISGANTCAYL